MKVIGLDGKQHSFLPQKNSYCTATNKSSLHILARELIHELFPHDPIFEEVSLAGTATNQHGILYADFVLVRRKSIIEVHGEQHYKFVPYYHVDMNGWVLQRTRDKNKRLWCEKNSWTYVELKFDEQDTWRDKLIQT